LIEHTPRQTKPSTTPSQSLDANPLLECLLALLSFSPLSQVFTPSPSAFLEEVSLFSHRPSGARARYMIGLMSGTSMDGVDAVLADFEETLVEARGTRKGRGKLLAKVSLPMPAELRHRLMQLNRPTSAAEIEKRDGDGQVPGELHSASVAGNALAELYAEAVHTLLSTSSTSPSDILAIANHGQTVRHRPEQRPHGYTIQIGNNALLAELTGIPVVGEFRTRDVAAGGQGAPLVPRFHQHFFGGRQTTTGEVAAGKSEMIILNLGGIANISHLTSSSSGDTSSTSSVRGFDTGPANVLCDLWTQRNGRGEYDQGGKWAQTGSVIEGLLEECLTEPYFTAAPPKSTGRDLFHAEWLDAKQNAHAGAKKEDVAATLVELTAVSVARAIKTWCDAVSTGEDAGLSSFSSASSSSSSSTARPGCPIYVCGGGAYNTFLLHRMRHHLPSYSLTSTSAFHLDPSAVEAMAFAWMGWEFLRGRPTNLPAVTGAQGERILGAYFPA
jgi:anhydro-N-acetylmuramic acid kinase